jgi:ATP-dependent Clp protease ATP-binding subunit ClpA
MRTRANRFEQLPDSVLARAGTDLSYLASEGRLTQAFGVDSEVAAICKALGRADKASCALVGPAGVGKSAIVEELARRQVRGDLPQSVISSRIVRISLQELAGLQSPGRDVNDYWTYFRMLLDEARANSVILFLDEAQALQYWPLSCQTLKPYLARGELRVIAATTPDEFDTFIRGDPALERRFQVVVVKEPGPVQLHDILTGVAGRLRERYGVSISSSAIEECIRLARYLPQHQPDASIDLLELAAIEASQGR